jgi:uncharacterized protein YneF (UPF0154 family)
MDPWIGLVLCVAVPIILGLIAGLLYVAAKSSEGGD